MAEIVAPTQVNNEIETRESADKEPVRSDFWLGEIEAAKKREEQWWRRGQKVIDRYRDERNKEDGDTQRVNILWSNTEILKGALFSGTGQPDVRRRVQQQGPRERATRQAAIILERSLSYCHDAYDADSEVEAAVEDHLLPGRGITWAEYEADVDGETGISDQRVRLAHVYWRDFLTSFGRKWQDVWWVARRHLYSRDELRRYFADHADKVPLGADIDGAQKPKDSKDDTFKRAAVWEIWDKSKKERIWVAEGYEFVLQSDPDPYKLQAFFPCQEPLYGVKTTGSLVPVPEYTLYQDQAQELDRLTTRLDRMIDALRRRGVYDDSMEGTDNRLSQIAHAGDNEFLPYKGFAALMEKGGLKGVFQAEDLAPIIAVVDKLYDKSQVCIQRIYEVTGISDVLRGSSNPNETATAQRIKGQFGSLRIQKRQARVNRFVRDGYRIKAEIIAEHYTREKLEAMTAIRLPLKQEIEAAKALLARQSAPPQMGHNGGPPMQGQPAQAPQPGMVQPPMLSPEQIAEAKQIAEAVPWEDIEAILRSDERRGYLIDIETDNTAKLNDDVEKQARVEFVGRMQEFLQVSLPAAVQLPPLMPLIKELTLFGVKTFKVGRQLEDTFEDAFAKLSQVAQQKAQQEPPQDPAIAKVQADAQNQAAERQMREKERAEDAAVKQAAEAAKTQADERKQAADREHQKEMKALELEQQRAIKAMELEQQRVLEEMKIRTQAVLEEMKHQNAAELKIRELDHARDVESSRQAVARETAQNKQQGDMRKAELAAASKAQKPASGSETPESAEPTAEAAKAEPDAAQRLEQQMMGLASMMERMAERMHEMSESQARLDRTMRSPRRIIRDPLTNRASGVQIMDEEGAA